MVAITGQVPTTAIGTDAFQECDTVGITRSVTKHNELVMTADDLPLVMREAFHIATTGRPGPVLVDVPKDVLQDSMEWYWPTDDEVVDAARLPPEHQGPPADDPRGGQADPRQPSGRSSTSAAASSRPAPPRRCASWPS